MTPGEVEKIAAAVLYEGYLLFPYTRSAIKNQQRWTFGGVCPQAYSDAVGGSDPWMMQTQCIVTGSDSTTLDIKIRFLHVVDRSVLANQGGDLLSVDSLRVGDKVYRPWDEAAERIVEFPVLIGDLLTEPLTTAIDVAGGNADERLFDSDGCCVGVIGRAWQNVRGAIETTADRLGDGIYRVSVRIVNTTPWHGEDRTATLRHSLVSTHTILAVSGGEFLSLLEPPDAYRKMAAECENIKTWPVLVGDAGDRSMMLSSPIILYDYPQVSPETPGDLFDATEIDELLRFTILTLTDDEKREMRESDDRGREILERTESLTADDLLRLHAAMRNVQSVRGEVDESLV